MITLITERKLSGPHFGSSVSPIHARSRTLSAFRRQTYSPLKTNLKNFLKIILSAIRRFLARNNLTEIDQENFIRNLECSHQIRQQKL